MLLFDAMLSYSQILIDDGPIIINKQKEIASDFVIQGNSWNHRILTYWFSNGTNDINGDDERTAIRSAMDIWQNQTDIKFLEVCDSDNADIIILWGTGDHGDSSPFNGVGGTLAHGFYPPPNGSHAGDIHFDDAETWTTATRSNSDQPIDLITIAAHELGHSLGLAHSTVSNALMYAYYFSSHRYLDQDDIDGIRSIYGNPGTYDFISCPSVVCSSGNIFSVNDLPAVDSIIWSIGPGLTIFSGQNTNSPVIKATGNCNTWVSVRLVNDCGSITLPQKTIFAGAPYTPIINGSTYITCDDELFTEDNRKTVTWSVYGPMQIVGQTYGYRCTIEGTGNGYGWVYATTSSECDTTTSELFVEVDCGYLLVFTPNPASGETILSIESNSEKKIADETVDWELEVYDQAQILKLKNTKVKGKENRFNTSGWKEGIYAARVKYDDKILTGKLVVKK